MSSPPLLPSSLPPSASQRSDDSKTSPVDAAAAIGFATPSVRMTDHSRGEEKGSVRG
eukprot:CAMPEP_0175077614 /NCGR_PEP_ID=MMETSP0052_2-20121109/23508_1 /TAXON_ID=51329 ORGANISM="Polytomella parva, Strain SAG 63-3" /NCGR_SAMPLE_ID=MMETSP0052_2 /ASSEMBLY_ACC=CAM_ASM_000194 /LENGTH=56 /DNA_ID=CAMNT_0016347139 /DNA_START=144 /DNA_END=311 /DNA_ORIENTATION=+